jgi:hypothetical protein
MNNLRIAPEGQGQYKNAVNPLNQTISEDDEEAWPVNLERVRKTTPMGNNNPESGWKDLSWANKPKPSKPKMDGGRLRRNRRTRANKKRVNRRKTRKA